MDLDELSQAEERAIRLMRRMGYGEVKFVVEAGQPTAWEAMLRNRLDKQEWPGQIDLARLLIFEQ